MKHEKRALTVIVDLWCRMYVLICLDEGNVKAHLEALSTMYEQLKGMGEKIEDSDFMILILASLPKGYCSLINMISLQNHTSMTPLEPHVVDPRGIQSSPNRGIPVKGDQECCDGKGRQRKREETTERGWIIVWRAKQPRC